MKSSSNTTWNCGETKPVFRFKTRVTFPARDGDLLRYIPTLALGSHFGTPLGDCLEPTIEDIAGTSPCVEVSHAEVS